MVDVYSKTIIINKFEGLINQYSDDYNLSSNDLSSLADLFNDITNYCIITNQCGEKMALLLENTYKCSHSVSSIIGSLYDTNRVELKLNYLIRQNEKSK